MTWGAKIKAARKAKKINLTNLAEQVGISVVYMCQIEASKYKPAAEKVLKICVALDMNPWALAIAMGNEIVMIELLMNSNLHSGDAIRWIGAKYCTLEFAKNHLEKINNGGLE